MHTQRYTPSQAGFVGFDIQVWQESGVYWTNVCDGFVGLRYNQAMLEIQDIADRLGLSEHQARRLLRGLDTVLEGYTKRGRDNRILLDGSAIAILDRAVQLWRGGIPLRDLSETVASEITDPGPDAENSESQNHAEPVLDHCPACEVRQEMITDLRTDKERLLKMIEDRDDQLKALMPGRENPAEPDESENGSQDQRRPSRWRALKYVIFGR